MCFTCIVYSSGSIAKARSNSARWTGVRLYRKQLRLQSADKVPYRLSNIKRVQDTTQVTITALRVYLDSAHAWILRKLATYFTLLTTRRTVLVVEVTQSGLTSIMFSVRNVHHLVPNTVLN